jgi:RHS repeat-associated protein
VKSNPQNNFLKFLFILFLIAIAFSFGYAQIQTQKAATLFKEAQKEQVSLNWQTSIAKFQDVINAYPKSSHARKAYIEIGKYYKYKREWEKAIALYHKAIDIDPNSREAADAWTAEAAIYYFRQDFPRALKIFQDVLKNTKDWDQVKYCSYWIKELKRKMSFSPEESFSCGPDSLKIAFDILGIDVDEKELKSLFAYQENNTVSISGLAKVARQKGLKPKIVRVARSDIQNLNTPFISLVNPEHYVVVTGTNEDKFQYIDPVDKTQTQTTTLGEFSKDFKGYALIFLDDIQLAKSDYASPSIEEMKGLKGGVCWCCPPSQLGGAKTNCNVAFDGTTYGCPGMPYWMVNTANLNFIIQDVDFSYSSRGMPVEFIRTNNSDDPRESIFGRSWTFNYNITLVENPDKSIDIRRGDGKIDHFFWNGTRYQGPDTVYDTMVKNGDGSYSLKLKQEKVTENFDSQGKLLNIKDRNDNTIGFSYDAEGKLTAITDPNAKNIVFAYGANNKVSRITLADGRYVTFIYDANNNLIQSTDMKRAASGFIYDDKSYITSISTPHQGTSIIEYNSSGEGRAIKTITDAQGNKRNYSTYQNHYQIRVLDSKNHATYYKNSSNGYTSKITSHLGKSVSFEYDSRGNRYKIIDVDGKAIILVYDIRGNITKITDPLLNAISFTYDSDDNLLSSTDPKSNIYNFTYDLKSNLTLVKDSDNKTTSFVYNAFGQLANLTDANNGVSVFEYDAQGNMVKTTNPIGKITRYGYDTLGRATSLVDPKGNSFAYEYDGVDHLTKITYPDSSVINYNYNCCNLVEVRDKNGVLSFNYDSLGRMKSYTNYDNKTIAYDYDSVGNLITLTYLDNKKVNYDYDADDALIKVTDWLGNITQYGYDKKGNLSSSVSPGVLSVYKYNELSRLNKLLNYNPGAMSITSGFDFTLDSLANRTKIKKYLPLNNPAFNLVSSSYTYNKDNQLLSSTNKKFTYDDNGNLLSDGSNSYTYDYDNHLVAGTLPAGGLSLGFKYDSLGNRIQKTQGTAVTKYIVNPNMSLPSVLAETNTSGTITAYYVYGLGLISKIEGSNAYFYQYDGLGSTVAITDKDGVVKNKYAYDDFGNLATNSTETVSNPFKYVGKYGVQTDAPDLLYMRARYYSPSIGRFLNKDPIGFAGGLNMYAYVGGNPMNLIDPWGLKEWGPKWLQRLILPYGYYGGPANTDQSYKKQPMDSQDEIFMGHDKGCSGDQFGPANRKMFNDFSSLPFNPYSWNRKPRNVFWAIWSIPYRILAVAYSFWAS